MTHTGLCRADGWVKILNYIIDDRNKIGTLYSWQDGIGLLKNNGVLSIMVVDANGESGSVTGYYAQVSLQLHRGVKGQRVRAPWSFGGGHPGSVIGGRMY